MGLFSFLFKEKQPTSRELKKKDLSVAGTYYYQDGIAKLATPNKDYKSSAKTLLANDKGMQRIFQYNYINKPVELIPEPQNKHDKNAIKVVIAGELVGYIPREECLQVKQILNHSEIKYISAHISGGKYKVVNSDGTVEKDSLDISINVRIAYV